MPVQIRKAEPEDALAVFRVVKAAFAEYDGVVNPTTEAQVETLEAVQQDVAEGRVFLAFREGLPAGSARFEVHSDGTFHARRVAVAPEHRGTGVAEALMLAVEDTARQRGYTMVHLSTRKSLPRNLAFYRKIGYEIVSVEPHPRGPDWTVEFKKQLD